MCKSGSVLRSCPPISSSTNDIFDGCELTVDVAAIADKFSGLAVAVTVALSCTACLEEACKQHLAHCCFFLCTTFLLLYLGSFEQHVPHFLLACGVSLFLPLPPMTFAKADCPAFLFVVGAVSKTVQHSVARCQQREKFDWQESLEFSCWLVWTIFIFCCPLSIFPRHWRVARKSNFDS